MISVIATLKSNNNIIGYRFIQYESEKIMDVPILNTIEALKSGNKINGIYLSDTGELKGSNGSLDRYPSVHLDRKQVEESGTVIILKRILDSNNEQLGYCICDYKGSIKRVLDKDLIKYLQKNSIANGKLITVENDLGYISAINGTYETEVAKREENSDKSQTRATQSVEEQTQSAETEEHIEKEEYKDNSEEYLERFKNNPKAFNYDTDYYEGDVFDFFAANKLYYTIKQWTGVNFDKNSLYTNKAGETILKTPNNPYNSRIVIDLFERNEEEQSSIIIDKLIITNIDNRISLDSNREVIINELIICGEHRHINFKEISLKAKIKKITFVNPEAVITIIGANFKIDDEAGLDLTQLTNLCEIYGCFKDIRYLKRLELPENIETINSSFYSLEEVGTDIINIKAKYIRDSFNSLNRHEKSTINIVDGTLEIRGSFTRSMGIIQLSDTITCLCDSLSLSRCNKIPDNIREYTYTSDKMDIQLLLDKKHIEKIERVISNQSDIVISNEKNIRELNNVEVNSIKFESIYSYMKCSGRITCNKLELPKSIKYLNPHLTIQVNGIVDLREYPKLTKIDMREDGVINGDVVIYGDNITQIDRVYNTKAKHMYISKNLESPYSAGEIKSFSDKTTYYIVKKHPLEIPLRKGGKMVVCVESVDEMLELAGVKGTENRDKKANKAILFENDAEFKEMISQPEYKNYADILVKIKSSITGENFFYSNRREIYRRGVVYNDWLERVYPDLTGELTLEDCVNSTDIKVVNKNVFYNIAQFLVQTHISEPRLSYNIEDKVYGVTIDKINVIRHNNMNYIVIKKYKFYNSSNGIVVYMIVKDGKPYDVVYTELKERDLKAGNTLKIAAGINVKGQYTVYASLLSVNKLQSGVRTCFGKTLNKVNASRFIKVGDIFGANELDRDTKLKLSGAPIPRKITNDLYYALFSELIEIGGVDISKEKKTYYFDVCNNRVIETTAVISGTTPIRHLVTNTYDFEQAIKEKVLDKVFKQKFPSSTKIEYIAQGLNENREKADKKENKNAYGKYMRYIRQSNGTGMSYSLLQKFIEEEETIRETKVKFKCNREMTNYPCKFTDLAYHGINLESFFTIGEQEKKNYRTTLLDISMWKNALGDLCSNRFEIINNGKDKVVKLKKIAITGVLVLVCFDEQGNIVAYGTRKTENGAEYKKLFAFENFKNFILFANMLRETGKLPDSINVDKDWDLAKAFFDLATNPVDNITNPLVRMKEDIANGLGTRWKYVNDNLNLIRQLVK